VHFLLGRGGPVCELLQEKLSFIITIIFALKSRKLQHQIIKPLNRSILIRVRLVCKTVKPGQNSTRENNTTQGKTAHDKFLWH